MDDTEELRDIYGRIWTADFNYLYFFKKS